MAKNRFIKYLLLAVLLLNTLLPFYASVLPRADGKIALCTADGVRYVNAADVGLDTEGEKHALPHCPLCVLNGDGGAKAPVLAEADAGLKAPQKITAVFYQDEVVAQEVASFSPSAPRAPPSFL